MVKTAYWGIGIGWILLVTGAVGCGGSDPLVWETHPENGGTSGAGSSSTTLSGGGGGAPGSDSAGSAPGAIDITPAAVQVLCQQALGEKLPVTTIQDMKDTIRRPWALCSGQGIFTHAQAGIAVGADDRWAYLAWSADRLVAVPGLDNEGSLEYVDTSAMNGRPTIQVNFVNEYGWTFIAAPPTFSDVPRMMVLTPGVVEPITYVAVP